MANLQSSLLSNSIYIKECCCCVHWSGIWVIAGLLVLYTVWGSIPNLRCFCIIFPPLFSLSVCCLITVFTTVCSDQDENQQILITGWYFWCISRLWMFVLYLIWGKEETLLWSALSPARGQTTLQLMDRHYGLRGILTRWWRLKNTFQRTWRLVPLSRANC